MADQEEDLIETEKSLERVQQLNAVEYARTDLGRSYNFEDAIPDIQRVVGLFRQISLNSLYQLPRNQRNTIRNFSDSYFNVLSEIQKFDEKQSNAINVRNELVTNIKRQYQQVFDQLFPIIGYLTSRAVDFSRLETEGRSAIQAIEDKTKIILESLQASEKQATETLKEIRQAAAEQGVSQQATYFKDAADEYKKASEKWRQGTIWIALGLGAYGVATSVIHKIPFVAPTNPYDSAQLIVSKLVVFFVILFWLLLASRNFLANKHNELINRHRQRALQTFRALVDAASDGKAQDIVLSQAAQCIFGPQDTGFSKQQSSNQPSQVINGSIVDLLPTARALNQIAN